MIQTIIFDWHGVLDKRKFGWLVRLFVSQSKLPEDQLKDFLFDLWQKRCLGHIDPATFRKQAQDISELNSEEIEKCKTYILSIEPNQELWDILPQLKKSHKLWILSDCPADKTKLIKQYPPTKYFDAMVFSDEKWIDKRDVKFFETIAAEIWSNPGECLFVDDNEDKILIAEQAGFQGCHYQTIGDLMRIVDIS